MRPHFVGLLLLALLPIARPSEGRADASPPRPPDSVSAYSQYDTPRSMTLTWIDPTTREDGTALGTFDIIIRRGDTPIDSVPGGVRTFRDTGLSDGTFYTYEFRTRESATGLLSEPVTTGWHAGGDPVPAPPVNLTVTSSVGGYQLRWTNPTTQRDGTPLDDLGGARVRRNGAFIQFLPAGASSYLDTTAPTNSLWDVSVSDNERPPHTSDWSVPATAPPSVPNLQVSTTLIAIAGTVGGPAIPRTLSLRNTGDLHLSFAIAGSAPWLSLVPESGAVVAFGIADIQLSADPAGLAEGDHDDTLVVISNDPDSPRVTVPVRFTVGRSRLRVQPEILLFSISILDLNQTLDLTLENTGSAEAVFSIATPSRWLAIVSSQGRIPPGSRALANITATRTQPVGVYLDSLIVTSNDFDAPRRAIPVFLEVTASPPIIQASRSIIPLIGYTGGAEQRQALDISNAGVDTLRVSIRTTRDWLTAAPSSLVVPARESRLLNVIAHMDSLDIGNYAGDVVLESNDPGKPLTTVPVTLEVRDGSPMIAVSVDTLFYPNAACGDPGKSIAVHNPGASLLRATVSTSVPWLTTTATTFQVNAGGVVAIPLKLVLPLPAGGLNQALITFGTNAPAHPILRIPVIVPYLSPRAELETRELSFIGSRNGPSPSLPIHIANHGESLLEVHALSDPPLPSWLFVSGGLSLNPGEEGDLVFTVSPARLPVGRDEVLVNLQTNNCSERILVRIHVDINEGPPGLKVLDDSFAIDALEDGPPAGKGFDLANYAPVPVSFAVEESSPWLLVEPEAGTIEPGGRIQLSVMSAPAGLEPGDYSATFLVGSDYPGSPPVSRTVRLVVRHRFDAVDRNVMAIQELGTACSNGDVTVQFIELVAFRDVTYREAIGLRVENALGETTLEETNLFGEDREGFPWTAGGTWLLATGGGRFGDFFKGDRKIAAALDPRGGTLTLYDATNPGMIYQHFSYGIAADVPAPPPGMSLVRETPGVFHIENDPSPRRAGGSITPFVCECPLNTLVSGLTRVTTSESVKSLATSVSGRVASAAYDLPAGTLRSEAFRTNSSSTVEDVYFVIGDRAGSPVSFEAVLTVTGTLTNIGTNESQGGATLTASLQEETLATASINRRRPGDSSVVDEEVVLPVRTSFLEPFHLKTTLATTAGSQGAESKSAGLIQFRGLPAGARVLSCQGYSQDFGPAPEVQVLEARGVVDRAHVAWSVPGGRRFVTVERRNETGGWDVAGSAEVLANGRADFEEGGLEFNHPYSYRIVYGEKTGGETTVNVGPPPPLAIRAVFPNPARGGALWLTLSLPDDGAALVELFDVAGRRVLEKDLSGLGPGEVRVIVTEGTSLASGVYLARLTRGREARTAKAVVLR